MTTTIEPFEIEVEALRCVSRDTGATAFDALADKIEAMQAENAALKQRIEESARTFHWYNVNGEFVLGDYKIVHQKGRFLIHIYSEDEGYGDVDCDFSASVDAFDYCEREMRKDGFLRHIDTIIRPEGCDELSLHWLRLLGLLRGFWPCQQATGRRDSVKGRSITQRVVRQEP